MKFKNEKCIEISKKQYDEVYNIIVKSTCFNDAVNNISLYLKTYKHFKLLNKLILDKYAFNLTQAVVIRDKCLQINN